MQYSGYPNNQLHHPTNTFGVDHHGPRQRVSLLCAVLTHLILFITVFLTALYMFNWENPVESKVDAYKFNWHPILMVSAFVLFMGEAIIAYRLMPFDHFTQKVIHLILQTLALTASTVAIYFIITFHTLNKIDNFYNIHGILGLTAYSLFCVQYILGFVYFFTCMPQSMRAQAMPYHKYIGVTLFFLLWGAMLTGLMDRQRIQFTINFIPSERMANAAGMFIVLSGATILYHFSPVAKEKTEGETAERLLP